MAIVNIKPSKTEKVNKWIPIRLTKVLDTGIYHNDHNECYRVEILDSGENYGSTSYSTEDELRDLAEFILEYLENN